MNLLGYEHSMYQENKRTIYRLGDIEFDIDTWHMIPTYLQIEGKNKEQVAEMIKKLEIDKDKLSLDKICNKNIFIDESKLKNMIVQLIKRKR